MGDCRPPTTGDHVSVSGQISSASVCDYISMELYRHHMLVTSPATVVLDKGVKCYKVGIIHLNEKGIVEEERILIPGKFRICTYPSVYTGDDAVRQARQIKKQRPGTGKQVFNLFSYNCESFVKEAKTGQQHSRQVIRSIKAIAGTVFGAVGLVPIGALIGGAIGTLAPVPIVGTTVGVITGAAVAGAIGAALGNVPTAMDYASERMSEN